MSLGKSWRILTTNRWSAILSNRRYAFLALLGLLAFASTADSSFGAPLPSNWFQNYSAGCLHMSAPEVLRRVAIAESRLDPLALRNNTNRKVFTSTAPSISAAVANAWIRSGDSVDVGLMQINSVNFASLGLTVETALDPCRSLQAGARVLSAAYAQGTSSADRQAALLIALSRYNTGRSLAGLANGYVGQVLTARDDKGKAIFKSFDPANSKQFDWNVWAVASAAQQRGADWLVGSQDTSTFLIGAGAQPLSGEPHALLEEPRAAPGQ